MRRYVLSKWVKTEAVLHSTAVRPHIPPTRILSEESLRDMLDKYRMVYVKPDCGTFGRGVMRVDYNEQDAKPYRYRHLKTTRSFQTYEDLYQSLKTATDGRKYLAQKGIRMLKHDKNVFDLRVIVQTKPGGQWEVSGMIGRVSQTGKVVTNYHSGGKLRSVETLLSPYFGAKELKRFKARLKRLAHSTALALHSKYPGIREIGLDVAVDQELKPWVLEVNTKPDPYIFKVLKDKRIYAKVLRYYKYNKRK
ncbi:ATP-binding protein [Paenibacillus chitinolyticus]|uniref:ATP-binding protein n=1 Tax=Paenibacillus chitinolyticus TaxID=79263 RepID=A0A410X2U9_9BACL|nr:YheC/YheD family protein [Paenibacillus chitinolyticus]MCY9593795.1 YheC/YheD family protein [Paenibacillus chitinolyticus]MCY9599300.1 YheC/YheD family protein [Paenibacillus chitinolyticus]QAV20942.1 ATP-binding protein [Paenibacillus chitinolyticus]